ncbi:amidohydrolase family protein [Fodinisporobacter ferrooxydans]|uniref:Amidohydrolase family protein n=1 Tax=Fodinisporobacter ferrooxydans TaxID=2901836 RepID=A0ABY4CRF2_9BACL|nr:amidohydrolase family protein [Alicyclobacillaceae bacterium MYW30-H2]
MKIDAHQHYWKLDRNDYGWITPDLQVLYRDFLPQDLLPQLDKHGIGKTILVQAAPTEAETEFLLGLCESSDRIAGVVGWLDLAHPDFRQRYKVFRENPYFIGVRVMIQEMEDANEILQPHMIRAFRFFAEQDFPVDILIYSRQFPSVLKLLEQVPNLRGVIDHIGKPDIRSHTFEPWNEQIKEAANYPKLYCKLSGMVTEADHAEWKIEDFIPYVEHVIDVFGTKRILFGSDWPVCLLAASYDEVIDVLSKTISIKEPEQAYRDLFGYNAIRFYKLDPLLPLKM